MVFISQSVRLDVLCLRYLCGSILVIFLCLLCMMKYNERQIPIFPIQENNEQLLGLSSQNDVKVISNKNFIKLIEEASKHPRKRKMTDLTKNPKDNSMQVLINTWVEGSYSPIHYHEEYSEVFQILDGALAFFTFTNDGVPTCHILSSTGENNKAIIVEKKVYHGMTAAPKSMGYPGHAIVFENSGMLSLSFLCLFYYIHIFIYRSQF